MSMRNLLALAFFVLPLAAQTKPRPTLDEALREARTPLVLADGKFSEDGAKVLVGAVEQAQFVLIGEDHFTREIPQFVGALCDVIHPDAYAVEAGPQAAHLVNGLLHSADRIASMSAQIKAYPNSVAFLGMREENDLAAHCAAASHNPQFQLWGLDQEFLGSAGMLLDAMAATRPGPKSSAAIASARAKERTAAQAAKLSGDPGKLFLFSATEADLQPLKDAVEMDGNVATRSLLRELRDSWSIYRLNTAGSPDANRVRAELLKQNFLANYSSSQTSRGSERVLLKFGDNHVGKGFSIRHQRDLGNFVSELADGSGTRSLHILVLGARGTHATFGGYGRPLGHEPFVITDDHDYMWLAPAVADLLPQTEGSSGTRLTLFDLRRLRFRGIDLPRDWERIVYGYDLFVFIPELTPGSEIE